MDDFKKAEEAKLKAEKEAKLKAEHLKAEEAKKAEHLKAAELKLKAEKAKAEELKLKELKLKEELKKKVRAEFGTVQKVRIKTNERILVEAHFVDDFGNAAPVRDDPVWSSSDVNVVTCVPGSDPCNCDIRPAGKLGTAIVSVGGRAAGSIEVTVLPAELATQCAIVVKTVEAWQR